MCIITNISIICSGYYSITLKYLFPIKAKVIYFTPDLFAALSCWIKCKWKFKWFKDNARK